MKQLKLNVYTINNNIISYFPPFLFFKQLKFILISHSHFFGIAYDNKKLKKPISTLAFLHKHYLFSKHMWCDNAKWIWSGKRIKCSLIFGAIVWWKPHQNWTCGSSNITILELFKTFKYKGNWMLLLALSKNQYLRVLNHFAWSHHIHSVSDEKQPWWQWVLCFTVVCNCAWTTT